jgi:hypothetical protein
MIWKCELSALQYKTRPVRARRLGLVRSGVRYDVHITHAPHGANPPFILIAQLRAQDVDTFAKVGQIEVVRNGSHEFLVGNNIVGIHKQCAKERCCNRSKRDFSRANRESPSVVPD